MTSLQCRSNGGRRGRAGMVVRNGRLAAWESHANEIGVTVDCGANLASLSAFSAWDRPRLHQQPPLQAAALPIHSCRTHRHLLSDCSFPFACRVGLAASMPKSGLSMDAPERWSPVASRGGERSLGSANTVPWMRTSDGTNDRDAADLRASLPHPPSVAESSEYPANGTASGGVGPAAYRG